MNIPIFILAAASSADSCGSLPNPFHLRNHSGSFSMLTMEFHAMVAHHVSSSRAISRYASNTKSILPQSCRFRYSEKAATSIVVGLSSDNPRPQPTRSAFGTCVSRTHLQPSQCLSAASPPVGERSLRPDARKSTVLAPRVPQAAPRRPFSSTRWPYMSVGT